MVGIGIEKWPGVVYISVNDCYPLSISQCNIKQVY